MPAPRVAAVQAAYVLMDRDATIDPVTELTAAAAREGAQAEYQRMKRTVQDQRAEEAPMTTTSERPHPSVSRAPATPSSPRRNGWRRTWTTPRSGWSRST